MGRPDIKVDYHTINQTQGTVRNRYSVNIFFINESDFKIRIKSLILSTNGNKLSDIQIAYLNDWMSPDETRHFDWLVDFAENQEMINSLEICVEVESGEGYQIDFDLSGVFVNQIEYLRNFLQLDTTIRFHRLVLSH